MRTLLLCLTLNVVLLSAACPAQPSGAADGPPSGYAFPDHGLPQITLEARYITGPQTLLQNLRRSHNVQTSPDENELALPQVSDEDLNRGNGIQLVSARRVTESKTPVTLEMPRDADVRKILRAVQEHSAGNTMLAPKVTLFDNQVAEISDTTVRPFVVGLKLGDDGPTPQIQPIEDGIRMRVRCRRRDDGSVRLDLSGRISSIEDVGLLRNEAAGTVIQVPEVQTQHVQLSAVIPAGWTLAIWGLPLEESPRKSAAPALDLDKVPYVSRLFKGNGATSEPRELLLLLTPRIVAVEDLE